MFEPLISNLTIGGARILTAMQARWVGCGPTAAPRIYFANHTSHIDFVLLWSVLPAHIRQKTRPVAASDYWNKNAARQYMIHRVFHGVLVDREPSQRLQNSISSMVEALDNGDSLIFFPEGSRGTGECLHAFKCGIFHLAKARPQVELVPVWLKNTYRVMPKGMPLPLPLLCSAAFGKPIQLRPEEPKLMFLARLQQAVLDLSSQ